MNILINYQGRDGAGPACALEWAKGFQENGCQVYAVISRDTMNAEQWRKTFSEEHIFWVHTHKDKNRVSFMISTLRFMTVGRMRLKRKFRNIHFDFTLRTLYSHWAYLVDNSVSHEKIVTLCHDPKLHSGEKKYINKLYNQHISQSDDVFVLTDSFKNTVKENYNIPFDHIHYVPHGRMQMYKDQQDDRYRINFDSNKTNFVFFGRIEQYKGLHVLADACKLLKQKREDFTILVAGGGDFEPYREKFEALGCAEIKNYFISDEEVGCLFDGSKVVVIIPYTDATQSGVIPIAYEYDAPIIASDTGGLKEQLNNGKIGLFFECGKAEGLAGKMEYIMDHPDVYEQQVDLMRTYRENLNWDAVAKRLLDELYK